MTAAREAAAAVERRRLEQLLEADEAWRALGQLEAREACGDWLEAVEGGLLRERLLRDLDPNPHFRSLLALQTTGSAAAGAFAAPLQPAATPVAAPVHSAVSPPARALQGAPSFKTRIKVKRRPSPAADAPLLPAPAATMPPEWTAALLAAPPAAEWQALPPAAAATTTGVIVAWPPAADEPRPASSPDGGHRTETGHALSVPAAIAAVARLDELDAELDRIMQGRGGRRNGEAHRAGPALPVAADLLAAGPVSETLAEVAEAEVEIVTRSASASSPDLMPAGDWRGIAPALPGHAVASDALYRMDGESYDAYRSEIEEASVVIVRRDSLDSRAPPPTAVAGQNGALRRRLGLFGG